MYIYAGCERGRGECFKVIGKDRRRVLDMREKKIINESNIEVDKDTYVFLANPNKFRFYESESYGLQINSTGIICVWDHEPPSYIYVDLTYTNSHADALDADPDPYALDLDSYALDFDSYELDADLTYSDANSHPDPVSPREESPCRDQYEVIADVADPPIVSDIPRETRGRRGRRK